MAYTFYNHLKVIDTDTFHNTALICRGTPPQPADPWTLLTDTNPLSINQIIRIQNENYLTHWTESTKNKEQIVMLHGPKQR